MQTAPSVLCSDQSVANRRYVPSPGGGGLGAGYNPKTSFTKQPKDLVYIQHHGIAPSEIPMPWRQTNVMQQREMFINAWLSQKYSKIALCRQFGISRVTGDKWIVRFKQGGMAALADHSSRPAGCPTAVLSWTCQYCLRRRLAAVRAAVCRKRHALEHPERQRRPLCRAQPGWIEPLVQIIHRLGHPGGAHQPGASRTKWPTRTHAPQPESMVGRGGQRAGGAFDIADAPRRIYERIQRRTHA